MRRTTTACCVVALGLLVQVAPTNSSTENEALAEACQVVLTSAGFQLVPQAAAASRTAETLRRHGFPAYARDRRIAFWVHRAGGISCVIYSDGKLQAAIGAQHSLVLSYAAEEMKRQGASADEIDAFLLPSEEFASERAQTSYRSRSGTVFFSSSKKTENLRVENTATKQTVVKTSIELR